MNSTQRNKLDWSTLPEHLLATIAERCQSIGDLLRFRAVCKSFRSSVSPPGKTLIPLSARRTSFPVAMDPTPNRRGSHFLLTESTVYAIEPLDEISSTHETAQTWLVNIEESSSGQVRIKDPLCGFRFRKLSKELLPESLNLLDYRVKEITKAYRLELATVGKGTSRVHLSKIYQREPTIFVKVAASTCVDEFTVMAIRRKGLLMWFKGDDYNRGELVVWRDGDDKLTKINVDYSDFLDIIYHNKKFYALRFAGPTITFDSKSFNVIQVTNMDCTRGRHYLVKSLEDLFLVHMYWEYHNRQVHLNLEVFKLDEEKNQWILMADGLEDRVFFVGEDFSFSVSGKEFSGCKGNSVYFTHSIFSKTKDFHPGMNAGIFSLEDNIVGPLSTFPGYSQVFWPPPTWLKHHASSASHHPPPPH